MYGNVQRVDEEMASAPPVPRRHSPAAHSQAAAAAAAAAADDAGDADDADDAGDAGDDNNMAEDQYLQLTVSTDVA